jgi:hypothetical protein
LDARATTTIAASAALVGLAVAVGLFDPASLSKQRPVALGSVFLAGALLILVSAVLAVWAGWLHDYDVLDRKQVLWLVTDPDWGDTAVDARGKIAQFNARRLSAQATIRSRSSS